MTRDDKRGKGAHTVVRVACAIAFLVFSVAYIHFYQADILAVTQHALSHGQTSYSPLVGTPIIIVAAWAVQLWMYAMIRLEGSFHGFTYFPSLLLLGVLTSADSSITEGFSLNKWTWLLPLLLVGWAGVAAALRHLQDFGVDSGGKERFFRSLWLSLLTLALMMIMTGAVGNGDDIFHYRARAETRLLEGDTQGALLAGEKAMATDRNLTMTRCYALALEDRLGESLFTYPLTGRAEDMVPMEGGSKTLIYPVDSIYHFLGAKPRGPMTTSRYLELLILKGKASKTVADYRLCGRLVDRDLDGFVALLPQYYAINDSLPRHYKEALILYNHLRAAPAISYTNEVMDTDYRDMRNMEAQCKTIGERRLNMFDHYFGTYWWYYEYKLEKR